MANPYAPPMAAVRDIVDPSAKTVPADRMTRLGAAILDAIIFFVVIYLPLMAAGVLGGATARATDTPNVGGFMAVGAVLALIGLVVLLWFTIRFMRNGQTIAKKMVGIRMVRSDGSPASLGRLILLRYVLNGLIGIIPFYGLVDVLFIFGESRQCLHDKIADTIVVKA